MDVPFQTQRRSATASHEPHAVASQVVSQMHLPLHEKNHVLSKVLESPALHCVAWCVATALAFF